MRSEEDAIDGIDDLTQPGPAHLWSLIGRGLVLPGVVFGYAVFSWVRRTGYLPGRNGGIELYSLSACWMAVAMVGLALFFHARWWWGAKGFETTYNVLMIIACVLFIVGFFSAVVCGLGGV